MKLKLYNLEALYVLECHSVCMYLPQTYLMVTVDVRDFNDPPLFVDQETDLAVTEVSESRATYTVIHTTHTL